MKKVKIFVLLTLTIIVSTMKAQDQAQSTKIKEYGIGLYGLSNFSLQYRWGNEKKLFRVSGDVGFSGLTYNNKKSNTQTQDPVTNRTYSNNYKYTTPLDFYCGLGLSILKLKTITDNFGLVSGPSIGLTYTNTTNQSDQVNVSINNVTGTKQMDVRTTKTNKQELRPTIGFVFGAFYKINSSFYVYGEIVPHIYFGFLRNKKTTNYTVTSSNNQTFTETTTDPESGTTYGISGLSNSGALLTFAYRITK